MTSREYYLAHRSEIIEGARLWRREHPDIVKAYCLSHRSERIECSKRYYFAHRSECIEYSKLWCREHSACHCENVKRWKCEHPEVVKARSLARSIPLGSCCELCPSDDVRVVGLEHHHPDYSLPDFVVTVCGECHGWLRRIVWGL